MPFKHYPIHTNRDLYLWKIDETIEKLLVYQQNNFPQECKRYKNPQHIKQCLAKWLMINKLNISKLISKDSYGKSYLSDNRFISIAHSGAYVSILLSETDCGIDIENYRDKLIRIKNKFISPNDFIVADKQLHWMWTAKESIYKLYGKKSLSFKHDIQITHINFEENTGNAMLKNQYNIELFFKKMPENFIICMANYKN